MTIKTTMGILAGKASHFVLSKLGRGSTLPGKIALKFDKDIFSKINVPDWCGNKKNKK